MQSIFKKTIGILTLVAFSFSFPVHATAGYRYTDSNYQAAVEQVHKPSAIHTYHSGESVHYHAAHAPESQAYTSGLTTGVLVGVAALVALPLILCAGGLWFGHGIILL